MSKVARQVEVRNAVPRCDSAIMQDAFLTPPSGVRRLLTSALASTASFLAIGVFLMAAFLPVPSGTRIVLLVYGLAIVGWTATSINAGLIGLTAITLLLVTGTVQQKSVSEILATDVVWLILSAFLLGEAFKQSELGTRLITYLTRSVRTSHGLAWSLSACLTILAFIIPSTTGRAALMLPVLQNLPQGREGHLKRSLSLLIPAIVLVSTPVTLTGAAAHLLANEMLAAQGQAPLSFVRWLILAGPFGVIACVLTAWLVISQHVPHGEQLTLPKRSKTPWTQAQVKTLAVTIGMLALWATAGLHTWEFTTVMLVGVLILTVPRLGVLDWKESLQKIPWDMLIFAGSAVWLGKVLVDSGLASWFVRLIIDAAGFQNLGPWSAVLILAIIAVTAHVYLTSHTIRVAVLIPPLMAITSGMGWSTTALVFIAVVGIDYCLTFPVSSKAILLYELDPAQAADMFRLSMILMPLYVVLMVAFYFAWWAPLGLGLTGKGTL